ncbi:carboxymuconolactone decarboxylase family protein [Actinoplanes sp. TBRC 11911]|uniref:carboxymuconolactone decarboxylase family protein n=1 Tax=Actinoplanes sp. TBRC 11911 TaxID=2729386 RepID=UPI00145F0B18|nr:carboxymuconolactone decarboxylase family protein [Actinoplanes sp. TBRC 11911]NMO52186.1 carboxymuconolactone decarboxylase family protein [Actinoplanes sp. TBRC 11911]
MNDNHVDDISGALERLSESPEMLDGFLKSNALFEGSTLDPLAREVVVMVVAVRNGCRFCIGLHTGRLRELGAETGLIAALRAGNPVGDPRLEALRQFTLRVLATTGDVPDAERAEFSAAGYSDRNALEVVLGIGTYTMATLANRLVKN